MNNKLSDRFNIIRDELDEPIVEVTEQFDSTLIDNNVVEEQNCSNEYQILLNSLYNKVYTVPVWADYTVEEQKKMIKFFVLHNTGECDQYLIDNLSINVVGFGPIQYLLDNSNVSAVHVGLNGDVQIMIDDKILNTEIQLSEVQTSFVAKIAHSISKDKYLVEFTNESMVIQKPN